MRLHICEKDLAKHLRMASYFGRVTITGPGYKVSTKVLFGPGRLAMFKT